MTASKLIWTNVSEYKPQRPHHRQVSRSWVTSLDRSWNTVSFERNLILMWWWNVKKVKKSVPNRSTNMTYHCSHKIYVCSRRNSSRLSRGKTNENAFQLDSWAVQNGDWSGRRSNGEELVVGIGDGALKLYSLLSIPLHPCTKLFELERTV